MVGDAVTTVRSSASHDGWIPPVSVELIDEERDHVLLWQVRGRTDVVAGGEPFTLVAGHALWVPVRTPHRFTVQANAVLVPLFFDSSGLATLMNAPTLVVVEPNLRPLMLAHSVAWYTIIQPRGDLARQILAGIEGTRVHSVDLPLPTGGPALRIAEALRFDPGDRRGIGELAASVHASTRTIERRFRAETGMTLRTWRLRNRVESAAILLRSGATVEAVAHRVGYASPNAFRRAFTAQTGISPTAYVRQHAPE